MPAINANTRFIVLVFLGIYIITLGVWLWDRNAVEARARKQERHLAEEEARTAAQRALIQARIDAAALYLPAIDSLTHRADSLLQLATSPSTDVTIFHPVPRDITGAARRDSILDIVRRPFFP